MYICSVFGYNKYRLDRGEGSTETTIKTNLRLLKGRVKTQVSEFHSKSKGQAPFGIFPNQIQVAHISSHFHSKPAL